MFRCMQCAGAIFSQSCWCIGVGNLSRLLFRMTRSSNTSCSPEFIHEVTTRGNSRIARGAFGEIAVGLETRNRRWVAIKTVLPPPANDDDDTVLDELTALQQLGTHENICNLLTSYPSRHGFTAGTLQCLALEYCPLDLYQSLEWRRRRFGGILLSMAVIRCLAHDLFQGLAHMHSHHILHADIKPGNLLLTERGRLKICDFGLAKKFPPTSTEPDKALCTLHYRPPELLLGDLSAVHPSVDVFSAGCVVAELLQGRILFAGRTVLDQVSRVLSILGTPTESHWADALSLPDWQNFPMQHKPPQAWSVVLPRCTEEKGLEDFLSQTIALDPKTRISTADALQHEWLSQSTATAGEVNQSSLCDSLLPTELQIPPIILTPPTSSETPVPQDWKVADDQILELAAKRRGVLSSLEPWGK